MFGNKTGKLLYDEQPRTVVMNRTKAVFVEFQGATGSTDDDGVLVGYVPRDKITINVARISGFYDHTILIDGRKIRVMESYNKIALKILEAMR